MVTEKRLIDANTLMEQVKAIHRAVDTSQINTDYDTGFHSATSQIQGLIAYMPAVDAVEVVRCKDCRKEGTEDCPQVHRDALFKYLYAETKPDGFCSRGERCSDVQWNEN